MARFQSPEISSKPFEFSVSVGTNHSLVTDIDPNESPNTDSNLRVNGSVSLGQGFELELNEKLALRYQLAGAPKDQSTPGNLSHAISFGYGKDGNDNSTGIDGGDLTYKLKNHYYDLAWTTGYRLTEQWLVYGSVFWQKGKASIDYYQRDLDSACNQPFQAECFVRRQEVTGNNIGLTLAMAYSFTPKTTLEFEGAINHADWFDNKATKIALNVNLKYQF